MIGGVLFTIVRKGGGGRGKGDGDDSSSCRRLKVKPFINLIGKLAPHPNWTPPNA